MPVTDVEFIPVIVTARPATDPATGHPYQQPPTGTDPAALRLTRARNIRPGDWILGDCEQPTARHLGIHWGIHTVATWPAHPILNETASTVALDGHNPNWHPNEWIMTIPYEAIPTTTPAPPQHSNR